MLRLQPETTLGRGLVLTHELVDDIVLGPETKIAGKYAAISLFRDGKIVDFIDYVVQNDRSPEFG